MYLQFIALCSSVCFPWVCSPHGISVILFSQLYFSMQKQQEIKSPQMLDKTCHRSY